MYFFQALNKASNSDKVVEIQERNRLLMTITPKEATNLFRLLSSDMSNTVVDYIETPVRVFINITKAPFYQVKELTADGKLIELSTEFILKHGLAHKDKTEEYCKKFNLNYLHRENLTIIYNDNIFNTRDSKGAEDDF